MDDFILAPMSDSNRISGGSSELSNNEKILFGGRHVSESVWFMPGGSMPFTSANPLHHDWPVQPAQIDANEVNLLFAPPDSNTPTSALMFHCTRYLFRFIKDGTISVFYLVFPGSKSTCNIPSGDAVACAARRFGSYLMDMSLNDKIDDSGSGFNVIVDILYLENDDGLSPAQHDYVRDNIRLGISKSMENWCSPRLSVKLLAPWDLFRRHAFSMSLKRHS